MSVNSFYLKSSQWQRFCELFEGDRIYGTVSREGNATYEKISGANRDRLVVKALPPVESIKGYYFPVREKVATYSSGGGSVSDPLKQVGQSQTIVGSRACDVAALKVLDSVFLRDDFQDPFYQKRRDNTILVTTDCVEPGAYCFCNLVGGKPYAEGGYDINLSPMADGYVVSAGSDRGEALLGQADAFLTAATEKHLEQRDQQRQHVLGQLEAQNKAFKPSIDLNNIGGQPLKIKDAHHSSSQCVECGGCTYICPTCHCFLLFDQRGGGESAEHKRHKTWDSCLLSNYAKMAGVGGMKPTPRPELRNRFENRVRHKFEWMTNNLNLIGCVGCGRCEAACMGGSDIREILKDLQL